MTGSLVFLNRAARLIAACAATVVGFAAHGCWKFMFSDGSFWFEDNCRIVSLNSSKVPSLLTVTDTFRSESPGMAFVCSTRDLSVQHGRDAIIPMKFREFENSSISFLTVRKSVISHLASYNYESYSRLSFLVNASTPAFSAILTEEYLLSMLSPSVPRSLGMVTLLTV